MTVSFPKSSAKDYSTLHKLPSIFAAGRRSFPFHLTPGEGFFLQSFVIC